MPIPDQARVETCRTIIATTFRQLNLGGYAPTEIISGLVVELADAAIDGVKDLAHEEQVEAVANIHRALVDLVTLAYNGALEHLDHPPSLKAKT